MRFHTLIFLSFLLAFAACEVDETTEIITFTQTTLSGETVTANFFGQLTNDQDQVVANAEVRIGNKQTRTDQEGLWSIDNAMVVKDQAFIQFAADRHHKGSRTLLVDQGGRYEIDLEMLEFTGTLTVDAAAGGIVQIPNSDASVSFPSSAFAKTDGTPYTGTVRVEAAYLDPNERSTADRMPGDLRATTSAGDSRLLITYGMVSVELYDDTGNELQLAAGQTATISLPVTGDAAASAPASIPLWYFDDATAQWLEEGSATLQNGSYVGEVSHFTFWNCDIPTDYIRLCGTVIFQGLDSLSGANLRLLIDSQNWGSASGYTDENGQFCGIVPANETLTFIVSGDCNQTAFSVTIGPYSADTDLGTIIVPLPQNLLVNVSGTASCNGTPLGSGAVRVFQNGRLIAITTVDANGSFSTDFISCDTSDINVRVINYATLEESENEVFAYANTITTGDISACAQALNNHYEIIFDGTSYVGDSVIVFTDSAFYSMFGSSIEFPDAEFNFFCDASDGSLPAQLAVGSYTLPAQAGINIFGFPGIPSVQYSLEGLPFEITKVASQTDPYAQGSIGPGTVLANNPNGGTTAHVLEIRFSAYSF